MRGSRARGSDPNATYYVMLRDAERKILRDVIEYHEGNVAAASETLGVSRTLIWKRAGILGGVLPNDPRREPFHYATAVGKEPRVQKRRNSRAAVTPKRGDQSEATNQRDGTADGAHAVEAGLGDRPGVE